MEKKPAFYTKIILRELAHAILIRSRKIVMKQNHEYFKDNSLMVKYFDSLQPFASTILRGLQDAQMVISPLALAVTSPQPAVVKRDARDKRSFWQNNL